MITRFLLFEDVMSLDEAREQFKKYNPSLDISEWEFVSRSVSSRGYKVTAEHKSGRAFFVKSPCHFWKWSDHVREIKD